MSYPCCNLGVMDDTFSTPDLDAEILNWIAVAKGDLPGHDFHGNQYTTGYGAINRFSDVKPVAAKAFIVDPSGRGSLKSTDPAPLGKDLPAPRIAEVSRQQRNGSIKPQYNFAYQEGKAGELVHPDNTKYDSISMNTKGELDFATEVGVSFKDGNGWDSPMYDSEAVPHEYTTNIEDQLPIMGQGISEMHNSPLAGCTDFSLSRETDGTSPSVVTPNTMVWGTTPSGDRAPMTTVAQFLNAGSQTDPFFEAAQNDFDSTNNDY